MGKILQKPKVGKHLSVLMCTSYYWKQDILSHLGFLQDSCFLIHKTCISWTNLTGYFLWIATILPPISNGPPLKQRQLLIDLFLCTGTSHACYILSCLVILKKLLYEAQVDNVISLLMVDIITSCYGMSLYPKTNNSESCYSIFLA